MRLRCRKTRLFHCQSRQVRHVVKIPVGHKYKKEKTIWHTQASSKQDRTIANTPANAIQSFNHHVELGLARRAEIFSRPRSSLMLGITKYYSGSIARCRLRNKPPSSATSHRCPNLCSHGDYDGLVAFSVAVCGLYTLGVTTKKKKKKHKSMMRAQSPCAPGRGVRAAEQSGEPTRKKE